LCWATGERAGRKGCRIWLRTACVAGKHMSTNPSRLNPLYSTVWIVWAAAVGGPLHDHQPLDGTQWTWVAAGYILASLCAALLWFHARQRAAGLRRRFYAAGSLFVVVLCDGLIWIVLGHPVRGIVSLFMGVIGSIVILALLPDDGEIENPSSG
jgi:hypothetical protein